MRQSFYQVWLLQGGNGRFRFLTQRLPKALNIELGKKSGASLSHVLIKFRL